MSMDNNLNLYRMRLVIQGALDYLDRDSGNINEALDAREIVKVSVLETAPLSSKEAIEEVMNKISGCEAVQVIGRKFVVYKRNLKDPKIILP